MSPLDIPTQRLHNQHLSQPGFDRAAQVVAWMGAVQAQDYAAAKWALGLRAPGLTDADVDRALADGSILRTHVLRPTWHFVAPDDIRWMLALTAPRINALSAYYFRQLGLDQATFARSNQLLAKTLQGGKQLTRAELSAVLERAGIFKGALLGFTYLMIRAELDAVICSGARRGKQFTYALLEERVPQARRLEHDEALAELARRYFTSHGPATLADFAWWSGLAASDARAGLEMASSQLLHETLDKQTCWFAEPAPGKPGSAYLLPNFDEYTVAYADRSAVFDRLAHNEKLGGRGDLLSSHTLVIDGRVAGSWQRTLKKKEVVIALNSFSPLTETARQAVALAAQKYGAFLELPAVLKFIEH